jgi:uncharacterized protein YwgA
VDFINIQEDNEIGFKNRFRLQKLIHIAQSRFSLPSKYFYSIYKHGPYAPSLTDDVYKMDVSSIDDIDNIDYELNDLQEISAHYKLPANFDENRFISLLSDKDEKWLEIASTLILVFDKKYHEKAKIIEYTASIKPSYSKEYIQNVFLELVREKLILTVIEDIENVVKRAPDLFEALAKDDLSLIKQ